jgi:hypothetical protein
MTEAATDLWKGTDLDAKHDFQPKISVQNGGAEQVRLSFNEILKELQCVCKI